MDAGMDLAPKPQNPWEDAVHKIFAGFCDPKKEADEEEENDEKENTKQPKPMMETRSVSFSDEVIVSDGTSTPQAQSLNPGREAGRSAIVNKEDPPSEPKSSKRTIFPERKTQTKDQSVVKDANPAEEKQSNGGETAESSTTSRELPGTAASTDTQQHQKQPEQKPRGILKPPVTRKKAKPRFLERLSSPRGQRTLELLALTAFTLVVTLSVLYTLGYRWDVSLDPKSTPSSVPILVAPKQEAIVVAEENVVAASDEEEPPPEEEAVGEEEEQEEEETKQHVSSSFAHEEEEIVTESFDEFVDPAKEE